MRAYCPLGSLVDCLPSWGVATRTGIMMITHFQHLEDEEGEPFVPRWFCAGHVSGLCRS